jgi:hypothetical protein
LPPGIDGPSSSSWPRRTGLLLRLPAQPATSSVHRLAICARIKDTLISPWGVPERLRRAFAGLTLFTGEVALDLGDGAGESIPFSARLEDMTGDIVEFSATPEGTGVRVTVSNAIESPISLKGLPATLTRGGQSAPAMLSNADFANPVQLAPGAAVQGRAI